MVNVQNERRTIKIHISNRIGVGIVLILVCLSLVRPFGTYMQLSNSTEGDKERVVGQIFLDTNHSTVSDTDSKASSSNNDNEITFAIEDNHEPYLNRWQRRFASSKERNKKGGYLFFKHMRKAGGTSLRDYFRDVLGYHNVTRNYSDFQAINKGKAGKYQIHYIEHEFQTIDWQCPTVDPRWQESLRIVVLRHPIERHLSEFFFSGNGKAFYPIDKQQLSTNETYRKQLASFLSIQVPRWMEGRGMRNNRKKKRKGEMDGMFNMIFGPHYTNNFQLRALAGCSSADCMKDRHVTDEQKMKINNFHPSSHSYSEPVPKCTNYFRNKDSPALFDTCAKPSHITEYCSEGCDGPCFYPSVAWGEMRTEDVTRALTVLKAFDAVLLMEKLGDQDQSDFLSDILGVPRNSEFSLFSRSSLSKNIGVEKKGKEKTHFYQDLLLNLRLEHILNKLREENKLEIVLFNHAMKLNEMVIEHWKGKNISFSS